METLKSLMKKASSCSIKRKFDVNTVISDYAKHTVEVECKIRDLIFKKLNNVISDEELKEVVDHIYDDNEDIKGNAKKLRSDELYRCLDRYLASEKRIPLEAPGVVLDVWGTDVNIDPDAIFVEGNKIEVVKYFFKKPEITSKTQSLSLYSLLYYGKQVAETMMPGKEVFVTASFYYLRKKSDKNNELFPEKNNFDIDFFVGKGGGNVISLVDSNLGNIANEEERVTRTDVIYHDLFKVFQKGETLMPNTKDCEYCSLRDTCSYHEAKAPIPSVPKGSVNVSFTEEQKDIINFSKGIARVNAGAGTGKTMTVAGLVAKYLTEGYKPEEIVVLTFTEAAAKEMLERIKLFCLSKGIETEFDKLNILTFNALGDIYLKEFYQLLTYNQVPNLIETSQCNEIIEKMLLETVVPGLNYGYLRMNQFNIKGGIAIASACFDTFKTYNITREDLSTRMQFILDKINLPDFVNADIVKALYEILIKYNNELLNHALVDYNDQISVFAKLDKINPSIFTNTGYKKFIVDEAQDTNEAQIDILKILMKSKSFESLVIVGDDSQSIYGFRGATPYNFVNFEKVIGEDVKDFFLTKNFRSTPQIIDLANKVNKLNNCRVDKTLVSMKPDGPDVSLDGFTKADEERSHVAFMISNLINKGTMPEDIAFIARKASELEKMQELLDSYNIDSTILVPEKMKNNSRVLAIIGLYKFLTKLGDESGICTYVNACIDGKWLALTDQQRADTLAEHLAYAETFNEMPSDEKLSAFKSMLDNIPGILEDEVYGAFVESINRCKTWESLNRYLYAFDVFGDNNTYTKKAKYPGVTLTTAHSSKGLEWNIVFNSISNYDKESLHTNSPRAAIEVEEERRLLFVSITRAKEQLFLSSTYYNYGSATDFKYKQEPGANANIFLKELYTILNKGDMIAECLHRLK